MSGRWLSFLFALALGAGLASGLSLGAVWALDLPHAGALGAFTAAVSWFLIDTWRAARVLRWMRAKAFGQPEAVEPGRLPKTGVWGDVATRLERWLRDSEARLHESDARLQDFLSAIQQSPNGVVLLDAAGRIEWCNLTASAHLGLDAERDKAQFIHNLLRDPRFAAYWQARRFDHELEIEGRSADVGSALHLSVQLHPYGGGRHLMLSRDVTALQRAETMRRDFVANVSHEIRTPLTVLAGFIETMQNLTLGPDETRHLLGLMDQQSQRMQSLVNDLLTLSRLEGSPWPGNGEGVVVAELLRRCEDEARALAKSLGVSAALNFDAGAAGDSITGAGTELHSALSNLVSNALRYAGAAPRVDVSWTRLPDGRGVLMVSDNGPGIAPEHLPRLTERFYRVDRSRSRDTGGTGLGLAIVKHVLQRHGGELRIDSALGRGSSFVMLLPAFRVRTAGVPQQQP